MATKKLSQDAKAIYDALKGRDGVKWADVKEALPDLDLTAQVQAWNELLSENLAEGLIQYGGVGAVFSHPVKD